ncbi:hypothetical protein G7B40_000315 [Aetokthonos hydrillicola Thurmond2011]|jgi:hypothetical protein|uniref:Uncharacterized protein n=1 Tax=Aetokthonos hydrillicola Thurmond2011 TaxID=2712845 RepID=A0AAP5M885_9CYAN|nr:hypothetical protein [Aetokthonos hydrillicola]MBO3460172.1 hypothetical protein [Aetokthonos hydrillicola CCALA 1050]MBW4590562.1 hypothetical protein [Aetokthonos hydrillicola CCALA 1050]MDR9893029.1 hypothetical protein [Aetokthonos hydrillicola Thurmond2011]
MCSLNAYSGKVEIYEFSRGFSEVCEKDRWISGGFGNAIDRSNYNRQIPAPIQQFINNNQNIFGIPTGFAPATEEVALIARVIDDRYCVLAVANYQGKDNTGRDGIVGYRYFWLDKNSEINKHFKLDGVGTLLNWWLKNPNVFDMNPKSFTGNKLVCDEYIEDISSNDINSSYQQKYSIYPSILTLANYKGDIRRELHTQAVEAAKKAGLPLAWAWNVRKLYFPEMYVAIWCENEAAKQTIERELATKGVTKEDTLATPQIAIEKRIDGDYLAENEKSIAKILDEFVFANSEYNANTRSEKASAIVEILSNEEGLNWSNFFVAENQHIKHLKTDTDPRKESVKYYALLPLLIPEEIVKWLKWLRGTRNKKHIIISFETQKNIVDFIQNKSQKIVVYKRIYDGISILLNEVLYNNTSIFKLCKWLLVTHKDNIWSISLNNYVANIVEFLDREREPSNESGVFSGQVTQEFLIKLRSDLFNEQVTTNKPGYKNLAKLLSQRVETEINYFSKQYKEQLLDVNLLSAICYQYSEKNIPYNVLSKLEHNHKNKISIILHVSPKEKRYHLRIWRNRLILGTLTLGFLIFLFQFFSILHLSNPSNISLKESIDKCKNVDNNTNQYSDKKQQLQRCEEEIERLLPGEIDKLSRLSKSETPDEEKDKLRERETYRYIIKNNKFINSSVVLKLQKNKEIDQYVLNILKYLQQSIERKEPFQEILKNLQNCANKNEVEEFKNCVQNFEIYKNKR